MSTAVIIVAAGRGLRAGGGEPKQWRRLRGERILDRALAAFRRAGLGPLVVVTEADRLGDLPEDVRGVEGGATRGASVRAGLEALAADPPDRVLIHDAARPLVSQEVIRRVVDALDTRPGAAPALPVTDALWRGHEGLVQATAARDELYRAQTPQGFRFADILAAHRSDAGTASDDVEVARAAGLDVAIVAGDEDNMKITGPEDFSRAERLLGASMDIRTGNGFDVHRFGPGEAVTLCGVSIPHDRALQGHSDADVGMHALTDAIYGALAEGDIGRHFPPSDPQWKGAESHIFLAHACELARGRGYDLTGADVTLVCEAPKIGPHAEAMRAALAGIAGVETGRISVKATTSERLGFTGREEGIAALATATLVAP